MAGEAPVFHAVALAGVQPLTPELTRLTLAVPPTDLLAGYRVPGQYVQIKEGEGKPGFFAIANGPGGETFEFAIKGGSPLADALIAKRPGDMLAITVPAGKGYPMAEARGRDVVLFAAGSGIAPVRAVVHEILKQRDAYGSVKLYYGARTAASFAFDAELSAWLTQKIEVTRICSQPGTGTWNGITGHVQDVFRQRKPHVTAETCIFACGMKGMIEGVKAACQELGVPPTRVFQNF